MRQEDRDTVFVSPTEAPAPLTEQFTVSVPWGNRPVIDGALSPGEWDGAAVETFSDGSTLFVIYGEGNLYPGIRSSTPEMIVGNIFIDRRDEIAVLHASAALGTALYEKGQGSWHKTQAFVWRCIKTDDGAAAHAERDAFLQQERWLAANSRMGLPNELEYQIEVTEGALRLAVNFIRASNPNVKIPWPTDLDDDCIRPTPGGLPTELSFSPDKWAMIDIRDVER